MRVLLVDDEIVALNALKRRVDWVRYGFTEVLTAQDCAQAKELFRSKEVELALCDIEMPGENGISLVQWIRENYPGTQCVMVTCHADVSYMKQSMKQHVWDYILKPIDYQELDAMLVDFAEKQVAATGMDRAMEKADQDSRQEKSAEEEQLKLIAAYIEEHIQEKIYVEDLAKLLHINEQYFMRVFKGWTGKSVTEYITDRRMYIAETLLRDTDKSINFIADCVGCDHYSYFTKLFKKHTGLTPREYRMRFRNEESFKKS